MSTYARWTFKSFVIAFLSLMTVAVKAQDQTAVSKISLGFVMGFPTGKTAKTYVNGYGASTKVEFKVTKHFNLTGSAGYMTFRSFGPCDFRNYKITTERCTIKNRIMTEKNISQSVEIFDYTERSENGGDTRYHAANREREVLLRYLLERLNMETGHLSDKQTVRK